MEDDMKQALSELEREVTCAVCLHQYTEPKVLPCLHYYCKLCVIKMAAKKNPLTCPECRKETKVTAGKEEELPTAHFINRLKELYAKQEKALSGKVCCEICTKHRIQAESFCKQCEKFICRRCVESHTFMTSLFEGHKVISIEDFKKLSQDEVFSKNSSKKKCLVHDKTLKIYCYRCEALICRDCIIIDHKDHKIQFNDAAANKKREHFKESITLLTKLDTQLSEASSTINKASKEIKEQRDHLASEIESSFKVLQIILDDRKKELYKELKERVDYKLAVLTNQNTGLSEARDDIHRVVNYTQQCVQHCSDIDIMEMHQDLSHTIQQNVVSSSHLKGSSSPAESADLSFTFNCAPTLQALCKDKVTLIELANKLDSREDMSITQSHLPMDIMNPPRRNNSKAALLGSQPPPAFGGLQPVGPASQLFSSFGGLQPVVSASQPLSSFGGLQPVVSAAQPPHNFGERFIPRHDNPALPAFSFAGPQSSANGSRYGQQHLRYGTQTTISHGVQKAQHDI